MVEEIEKKKKKGKEDGREEKRRRSKWSAWLSLALLVLSVAIVISWSTAGPKIGSFTRTGGNKPCSCSKDKRVYSGIVEDCCCDYETVDHLNEDVLHPLLQDLGKTPFFRYFKVKLWCDCPFWPDDGMCRLQDCSVCECPDGEFPETFKRPSVLSADDPVCQEGKPQSAVDRTLDKNSFTGWSETDNPWTFDDETGNSEMMTYVNLLLNPERYTGYTGPSARRIWDAVYSENCPKYPSEDSCQEEKILYKFISGLHSSISVHIAAYLLDEATNLIMSDYLEHAEYDTGNPDQDLIAHSLMRQLLYDPKLQAACSIPFDEAKLWKGQSSPELKLKFQMQFRNISAIMDCVGCEKCRLWGKLQVLGLGTALKILFSVNGHEHPNHNLQLQRNEVIALMNLLNRLSESIKFVHETASSAEIQPTAATSPYHQMWASLKKTWSST